MGTPWGCPTTGATPSERKHRISSQGRRQQSWWGNGGLGEWSGGWPQQGRVTQPGLGVGAHPQDSSSGPQEAQIQPTLPTAASRARL